jgi:hypothetical protein
MDIYQQEQPSNKDIKLDALRTPTAKKGSEIYLPVYGRTGHPGDSTGL